MSPDLLRADAAHLAQLDESLRVEHAARVGTGSRYRPVEVRE